MKKSILLNRTSLIHHDLQNIMNLKDPMGRPNKFLADQNKLKPPTTLSHFSAQAIKNIINLKSPDNESYLSLYSLSSLILKIDKVHIELLDSFSKQKK